MQNPKYAHLNGIIDMDGENDRWFGTEADGAISVSYLIDALTRAEWPRNWNQGVAIEGTLSLWGTTYQGVYRKDELRSMIEQQRLEREGA